MHRYLYEVVVVSVCLILLSCSLHATNKLLYIPLSLVKIYEEYVEN